MQRGLTYSPCLDSLRKPFAFTLNASVKAMAPVRVLEVGSYMGSTAVAMCHDNNVEVIHMVDNHSEFGQTSAARLDCLLSPTGWKL
jgi:hypothetical protein